MLSGGVEDLSAQVVDHEGAQLVLASRFSGYPGGEVASVSPVGDRTSSTCNRP
jgi:hypothetical protein